jgi:hypothetical protein
MEGRCEGEGLVGVESRVEGTFADILELAAQEGSQRDWMAATKVPQMIRDSVCTPPRIRPSQGLFRP